MSPTYTRRQLAATIGSLAAGAAIASAVPPGTATAAGRRPHRLRSATVTYLSDFTQRRYFTYPHLNGFVHATANPTSPATHIVVGQRAADTLSTSLWEIDLATGTERSVATLNHIAGEKNRYLWYDVAIATKVIATTANNTVYTIDLNSAAPTAVAVYTPPTGRFLSAVASMHPDGTKLLASHYPPGVASGPTTCVEVDLTTGVARDVVTSEHFMAHFQYCEADPNWIGYSNQNDTGDWAGRDKRMWVVHPTEAPNGMLIWDQETPTGHITCTHDVWAFHDVTAIVVGYGGVGQRGLWQVWPDGRPARLVSASNEYNHCSISHDGQYAVIDTAPTAGNPAARLDLITMDGSAPPVTVANFNFGSGHPNHGHPSFSQDGQYIGFTDTEPGGSNLPRVGLVTL